MSNTWVGSDDHSLMEKGMFTEETINVMSWDINSTAHFESVTHILRNYPTIEGFCDTLLENRKPFVLLGLR